MADVVKYLIYPEMSNDYSFPPEVRKKMSEAPEMRAAFADKNQTTLAIMDVAELAQDAYDLAHKQSIQLDGGTP